MEIDANMISQFLGVSIAGWILIIIIVILIMLLLNTIFLTITLSLMNSKDDFLSSVFVTALLCALVGWIPGIGYALCWVIINARHRTGILKAILLWVLSLLIAVVIAFVIVFIIFGVRVSF